jgi:hypothetical protein
MALPDGGRRIGIMGARGIIDLSPKMRTKSLAEKEIIDCDRHR